MSEIPTIYARKINTRNTPSTSAIAVSDQPNPENKVDSQYGNSIKSATASTIERAIVPPIITCSFFSFFAACCSLSSFVSSSSKKEEENDRLLIPSTRESTKFTTPRTSGQRVMAPFPNRLLYSFFSTTISPSLFRTATA